MEYPYMIVGFIDEFETNQVVEPPRHPHITIKKKFKLTKFTEDEMITLLKKWSEKIEIPKLKLGQSKIYDDDAFKIIDVINVQEWQDLHHKIIKLLGDKIESRVAKYDDSNYNPHITWLANNKQMFDPKPLMDTDHSILYIYLIQRVHPTESKAKIIAKFRTHN
ncbi:MAG: hypothetical protein NTX11_03540 [Candidatus Saccharibacteria bacterium]|nr:hypothetical protein [Candidatus Saccharibacteria bacterium]